MADPRLFTVKQCVPAYANKSGAAIINSTNSRRGFFDSIGKVGDLQVLNDLGASKIGSGLRNLASISNSIRVGTGALPTSIGSSLDAGANWVLGKVSIPTGVVDGVRAFNPSVANSALGQAKSVFQQVSQGGFRTSNIPGVLQDFQNLERLGRNIFTPGGNDVQSQLTERCEASPYAIDLIARAPKFKFLFIVEFIPAAGYEGMRASQLGPLDMAFTVKTTTRPAMKIQHEDVNYYNYRSKVVTRVEYEEMNMSFHDDTTNLATQFYKAYMRAISPISGMDPDSAGTTPSLLEQSGMNFVGNHLNRQTVYGNIPGSSYAASSGLLVNNAKQVFKEIRIYHLYDYGSKMNVFRFSNPRISAVAMDQLDMSVGSEGSEMTLSFAYDSIFMDTDVDVGSTRKYNISDASGRGATYPLRYNGDGVGVGGGPGVSPLGSRDGVNIGGFGNDGLNTLSNGVVGSLASAATSVRNAATSAVSDLGSKFSSALNSLPFG